MDERIERIKGIRLEIDDKRLNVPFIVHAKCPNCGMDVEWDLSQQNYLSYPHPGKEFDLGFYCYECGKGWSVKAVFNVSLTLVQGEDQ